MRPSSPIAYVLLYVALYSAFGVASPFWPKFFESKGLTPQLLSALAQMDRHLAKESLLLEQEGRAVAHNWKSKI